MHSIKLAKGLSYSVGVKLVMPNCIVLLETCKKLIEQDESKLKSKSTEEIGILCSSIFQEWYFMLLFLCISSPQ